ncbi:MAG: hypothetical protein KDA69_13390 [Planctomycetaceae bacterium]|nr:hypothetical protein [Planctomycetaceae bacterium]
MFSQRTPSTDDSSRVPAATQCVCTDPGFCERHQCQKTPHLLKLCQTRPDYFQLWEEGHGPLQRNGSGPGLLQRAGNFGSAVVRHVANGGKQVSESVYAARLSICNQCPMLNLKQRICTDQACGCYVDRKARWESEDCPQGKWIATTECGGEHVTDDVSPIEPTVDSIAVGNE